MSKQVEDQFQFIISFYGGTRSCLKLFFIGLLFIAPIANAQLPSKIKADDLEYREYMVKMSRHLGVSCVACHDSNNFASADKATFKISKDHIRLTQLLIDNGFDGQQGRPKADCYMCHRGKLKPDFKEKFDPMTMEKVKKEKKESTLPAKEKGKENTAEVKEEE